MRVESRVQPSLLGQRSMNSLNATPEGKSVYRELPVTVVSLYKREPSCALQG